ncbi:Plasmodium exported protein, unknown function [Plasmodium chabaudi adami]|uniref:Uncharacterized protein n=1 Tax=Plasmodium chabaudi adami TaxID=5826 RepID=A0A1D3LET0_PLACE|nr:Plasmodium exported protein, unknown function [Plasmodium chabaudi adami]
MEHIIDKVDKKKRFLNIKLYIFSIIVLGIQYYNNDNVSFNNTEINNNSVIFPFNNGRNLSESLKRDSKVKVKAKCKPDEDDDSDEESDDESDDESEEESDEESEEESDEESEEESDEESDDEEIPKKHKAIRKKESKSYQKMIQENYGNASSQHPAFPPKFAMPKKNNNSLPPNFPIPGLPLPNMPLPNMPLPNMPLPNMPIEGLPMPTEDDIKQMLQMLGQGLPQEMPQGMPQGMPQPKSSNGGHSKKQNNMPQLPGISELLPIMNMLGFPPMLPPNKPSSDQNCDCSSCKKETKKLSKKKSAKAQNMHMSIASAMFKQAMDYLPVMLPLLPTFLLMFFGVRYAYVGLYTLSLLKDAYNFIQMKRFP